MRSKRLELMDQISAYIDQYYCERQTTPWWPWMNAECLNTTDPLEPS